MKLEKERHDEKEGRKSMRIEKERHYLLFFFFLVILNLNQNGRQYNKLYKANTTK